MCGEKGDSMHDSPAILGSPPRVRGKDEPSDLRCGVGRITPACAGKRVGAALMVNGIGDHPRVCGEKLGDVIDGKFNLGSPPRVRGKERISAAE